MFCSLYHPADDPVALPDGNDPGFTSKISTGRQASRKPMFTGNRDAYFFKMEVTDEQ